MDVLRTGKQRKGMKFYMLKGENVKELNRVRGKGGAQGNVCGL